jgi:hypothetical protein
LGWGRMAILMLGRAMMMGAMGAGWRVQVRSGRGADVASGQVA